MKKLKNKDFRGETKFNTLRYHSKGIPVTQLSLQLIIKIDTVELFPQNVVHFLPLRLVRRATLLQY